MPFARIIGHRRLLALVSRAVARDTLPPSLLLTGPAGVGKFRTAVAVAQALNCVSPRTLDTKDTKDTKDGRAAKGTKDVQVFAVDACGTCAACRRIERRVHPDVLVIEPGDTGQIKIEQVRDAIDRAGYRPFEGRRRVVIIDEADALRIEAQHALLKTLEEPPAASVFLLVSSKPDALLDTVLSRCPRIRFGPLSAADVASVLVQDHGYGDADARAAAADAGGSVGQALAMQAAGQTAARAAARQLLERAARVTDPSRRIEAARDLAPSKKLTPAEERDRLAACLRALGSLLRDLELLALGADRGSLVNGDLESDLSRLVPAFDSDRNLRAFMAVNQALTALSPTRNANPKVVAGWIALQL